MSDFDREFHLAQRQRAEERPPIVRGFVPLSDAEERSYHRGMAKLCAEHGLLNLSGSHLVAVNDCPRGCLCGGCESLRRERLDEKAQKQARRAAKVTA